MSKLNLNNTSCIKSDKKFKINTYVINLKKDTEKWKNIVDAFKNTDLKLHRFDAIRGTEAPKHLKEKHVTSFCIKYCPRSVIGCGMSHILLAKYFLEHDPNEVCLILEDDVSPLYNNLIERLEKAVETVKKKDKDWDMLKVYAQNYYDTKNMSKATIYNASTGAYILSRKGAQKMVDMKLYTHVDMQQYYANMKIYINNVFLFKTTYDFSSTSSSNTLLKKIFPQKIHNLDHNPPVYWLMGINQIYIEELDLHITNFHTYVALVVIILLIMIFLIRYLCAKDTPRFHEVNLVSTNI